MAANFTIDISPEASIVADVKPELHLEVDLPLEGSFVVEIGDE